MTYAIRSCLAGLLRWLARKVDPEKGASWGYMVGKSIGGYADRDEYKVGGTD